MTEILLKRKKNCKSSIHPTTKASTLPKKKKEKDLPPNPSTYNISILPPSSQSIQRSPMHKSITHLPLHLPMQHSSIQPCSTYPPIHSLIHSSVTIFTNYALIPPVHLPYHQPSNNHSSIQPFIQTSIHRFSHHSLIHQS